MHKLLGCFDPSILVFTSVTSGGGGIKRTSMKETLRKVTVVARERGIHPVTIQRWAAKPNSGIVLQQIGREWFVDVTTLPGAVETKSTWEAVNERANALFQNMQKRTSWDEQILQAYRPLEEAFDHCDQYEARLREAGQSGNFERITEAQRIFIRHLNDVVQAHQ